PRSIDRPAHARIPSDGIRGFSGFLRRPLSGVFVMTHLLRCVLPSVLVLAAAHAAAADDARPMPPTPAMLPAPRTFTAPGFEADGIEALSCEGLPRHGKPTYVDPRRRGVTAPTGPA